MRKILLATALTLGLFGPAAADFPTVAVAIGQGVFCNQSINVKAGADYLNSHPLEAETAVLAMRMAASAMALSEKENIDCVKVIRNYGPNGHIIPGLLTTRGRR